MIRTIAAVLAATSVSACNRAEVPKTDAPEPQAVQTSAISRMSVNAIPDEVRAAALAARPTMKITTATLKEREGRRYYDVEGELPDGGEIELDLLEGEGGWKVVEIQRDIPWGQAPATVRAAADSARKGFVPVRVIESVQAEGGEVIYELFAPGQPATPALEVMVKNGKSQVLKEVWPH